MAGFHLFPFRTEKLSPPAPMVLHTRGRVGSRRFLAEALREESRRAFFVVVDVVVAKVAMASQHTGREAKGEENRTGEMGTMVAKVAKASQHMGREAKGFSKCLIMRDVEWL